MAVVEHIAQRIRQLPEREQAEVLDFVEYLLMKAERAQAREERAAWMDRSLRSALRGMEEEPGYDAADLKERFQ